MFIFINLSSANDLNLDLSKILLFGKELNQCKIYLFWSFCKVIKWHKTSYSFILVRITMLIDWLNGVLCCFQKYFSHIKATVHVIHVFLWFHKYMYYAGALKCLAQGHSHEKKPRGSSVAQTRGVWHSIVKIYDEMRKIFPSTQEIEVNFHISSSIFTIECQTPVPKTQVPWIQLVKHFITHIATQDPENNSVKVREIWWNNIATLHGYLFSK